MSVIDRIEKQYPIFSLKMKIISRFGLLPTDSRVKAMTDIQWLLLGKYIDDIESKKYKNLYKTITYILGVSGRNNSIIPLSFFINPEAARKLFNVLDLDEKKTDSDILTDDESKRLKDVADFDIEGFLTDEEKRKLETMNFDELLKEESLAGIKLLDGENNGG